MKMRGQLSQGLALPLADFPAALFAPVEGTDVTEALEVQKYEKPISANLAGVARGNFPTFIRKTDQERAQNLRRDILGSLDDLFEVTLKLDGSSMTVYKSEEGRVGVCSRNLDLEPTADNLFWKTARDSGLVDFLETSWKAFPFAVQGELMGPGVQGNREKLTTHAFYVYNIWDISKQEYMPPDRAREFIEFIGLPSLQYVPVIAAHERLRSVMQHSYESVATYDYMSDLLKFAEGVSINHPVREGLVFKSLSHPFSFKVINTAYLLQETD
jgi:RNA ligase (TIGR02306 family)